MKSFVNIWDETQHAASVLVLCANFASVNLISHVL